MSIVPPPELSAQTCTLRSLTEAEATGCPLFCVRLQVVGVSLKKGGDKDVLNPLCPACSVTDLASLHHHSNPTGWVWLVSCTDEAWEAPKGQISSSVHTAFKWKVWTQVCLIPKAIPSPLYPGTRWWTGTESLGSFQSTQVPRSHPQRFSSNWSGLFFFFFFLKEVILCSARLEDTALTGGQLIPPGSVIMGDPPTVPCVTKVLSFWTMTLWEANVY